MNILIIKLGAIGDVLRTTSILKGLKEKYNNCKIAWITQKNALDILKNNDLIDNILTIEDSDKILGKEYDLVISLDDEDNACQLASKLKSKKLIGTYLKDNKKTYTDDSAKWFDMGLTSKFGKEKADELKKLNKKTHQQLLSEILDIKVYEPILNLDKKDLEFAEDFAKKNNIKEEDLVIGINTSAGKRWPLKKLSIEKTIELIDKINNNLKAKLLLFGGPEEHERNNKIRNLAKTQLIDAGCNNTLMQFAALVNLCNTIIVSDSLAMNIAIALKKRVIAFFGPTSATEIELYNRGKKIIPEMECVCCYKKTCNKKPNCMNLIKIEEILEAIK